MDEFKSTQKMGTVNRRCERCGEQIEGSNTRRFCSRNCAAYAQKRKPLSHEKRVARFWRKVERRGPEECWEWKGTRQRTGYGRFSISKTRQAMAHRMSWELHNGRPPNGLQVCHSCDNPPCVNPKHLFLGTPLDNAADMIRKGRHNPGRPRGTSNHAAKLTEEDVLLIRARCGAGESRDSVALCFGVTYACVADIMQRRSWRHI